MAIEKSIKIFAEAREVMVGGVNSPVRSFISVGGNPLVMERGKGSRFSDVDGNGDAVLHDDNYGGYAVLDQMVWREKDDQGLSVFFMGGGAPQNRNTVQRHIAAGLNYTGLIPGRDADQAGVAFTSAYLSNKSRAASGKERGETTLEGTYRVQVNDNIAIQPDIQYVINPSGDRAIKNASVFTLRTEINF